MIADKFPVSKSLFVLETIGLIPNLGTISAKYLLKVFANSVSEVNTFLFSIKVLCYLQSEKIFVVVLKN